MLRDTKTTVSLVRVSDNFIISEIPIGMTGENYLNNADEKEGVIHYYDVCSFLSFSYGTHGIRIKNQNENEFRTISNIDDPDSEMQILISKFNNHNKVFIDIRNEHNKSFNYYNNVSDPIKYSYTNGLFIELAYPYWPLLALEFSPSSNQIIHLKIPTADISNARAYYKESNSSAPIFKSITFFENYSEDIKLKLVRNQDGQSFPGYFNLMFIREIDENYIPIEWVIKSSHFVDNLFDLEELVYTDSVPNLKLWGLDEMTNPTKWKIYESANFVSGINNPFIAKVGIAEDSDYLYFFAFSNGDSLSSGSSDIAIVSGDSEKADFFEDILLPKFNGTLSVQSYSLTVGTETFPVLRDNIYNRETENSIKLIPCKKDFVLLAVDKIGSVPLLKTAYLDFQNNHPKRLVFRDRTEVTTTEGSPFWEATIYVIGYGNNTFTNNFEIKEINTGIVVRFADEDQKIFGTQIFNEKYIASELEINASDFYGKIHKNHRYTFRDMDPNVNNEAKELAIFGLEDYYFKVLGKSRPNLDEPTQYYVELIQNVSSSPDPDNPNDPVPPMVAAGTKGFISKASFPQIFVRFPRFRKMLLDLNNSLPEDDTLEERITRLRKRGHDGGQLNELFDEIIGHGGDLSGAINNDDIQYNEDGNTISETINNVGDSNITVSIDINTDLQLFTDVEYVEFSNGKAAEIQHLFVGLDVIGNLMLDIPLGIPGPLNNIDVPNNVHFALHSGDAGTVPNRVFTMSYDDNIASKKVIDYLFSLDTVTLQESFPLLERYFRYAQRTRFSKGDRYGNLYSFGLYFEIINTHIVLGVPSILSPTRRLDIAFSGFNADMDMSEYFSVLQFFGTFNREGFNGSH